MGTGHRLPVRVLNWEGPGFLPVAYDRLHTISVIVCQFFLDENGRAVDPAALIEDQGEYSAHFFLKNDHKRSSARNLRSIAEFSKSQRSSNTRIGPYDRSKSRPLNHEHVTPPVDRTLPALVAVQGTIGFHIFRIHRFEKCSGHRVVTFLFFRGQQYRLRRIAQRSGCFSGDKAFWRRRHGRRISRRDSFQCGIFLLPPRIGPGFARRRFASNRVRRRRRVQVERRMLRRL
jgi:hypothetical protein